VRWGEAGTAAEKRGLTFAAPDAKEPRIESCMPSRTAGGGALYAGDCPPQMKYNGIHGVGLTLNF